MAVPAYKVELISTDGATTYDVTSYVQSIGTDRGRSRELDKFDAGTFTIVFQNRSRAFDPLYTSSPFYGLINPNRGVIITTGPQERFNGFIKDWNFSYDVSGESTAIANGADAFSFLAQQVLPALTPSSQLSGERIADLLALPEITWPFEGVETLLDDGQRTLQADTITDGTNALEYLQLVERTEQGFFFVNRFGQLEFQDSASEKLTDVVFADDNTDISYQGVEIVYGSELLYNEVSLSRAGGATQTWQNTTSVASFGLSAYQDDGLLYNSDADTLDQAYVLVAKYSEPEYRFDSVTVLLNPLSGADQSRVLILDLCDIVKVKFTPNGVGSAITKYARIIGISEKNEPDFSSITFKLATLDNQVFTLDSDVSGLLDYNVLGF